MSAKAARRSTTDAVAQMRVALTTYIKAARLWRVVRGIMRRDCACDRCRALRGARLLTVHEAK